MRTFKWFLKNIHEPLPLFIVWTLLSVAMVFMIYPVIFGRPFDMSDLFITTIGMLGMRWSLTQGRRRFTFKSPLNPEQNQVEIILPNSG